MTKQRLIKLLLTILIGIALAVLIAFYEVKNSSAPQYVVAENFGGPFTLTNQDGETVTEENFKNEYRLIYFGFTYCPAVCPTELQRINIVLTNLGDEGNDIQPIFITVDPERDTTDVMKKYVNQFHPRLIGLTGTPDQIKQTTKEYKIYAAKVQDDTMSDYTMDHSSFIYFMGPNDDLLRIFTTDDSVETMTATIQDMLNAD